MAHPHRDLLLRAGGGKAWQHLAALREQNPRAPPIGRCGEPGELDGAGKAQPRIHRCGDKFAVGIGGRDARHALGIADHQVIAALGFERHVVAQRGGERLRVSARADDRGIGRHITGVGLDRGKPLAFKAKPEGPSPDDLAAGAQEMLEQPFHKL